MAFPRSPSLSDTHTIDQSTWRWTGYAWKRLNSGNSGNYFQQDNPPTEFAKGDHWFNTLNGKLYIAIEDDAGLLWVEFTGIGGAFNVVIHQTTSVVGATYQANVFDYYIGVSYDGLVTITLPENPPVGKTVVVKDESGKASYPSRKITIQGASSALIDNKTEAVINLNNAALNLLYRNGWRII